MWQEMLFRTPDLFAHAEEDLGMRLRPNKSSDDSSNINSHQQISLSSICGAVSISGKFTLEFSLSNQLEVCLHSGCTLHSCLRPFHFFWGCGSKNTDSYHFNVILHPSVATYRTSGLDLHSCHPLSPQLFPFNYTISFYESIWHNSYLKLLKIDVGLYLQKTPHLRSNLAT